MIEKAKLKKLAALLVRIEAVPAFASLTAQSRAAILEAVANDFIKRDMTSDSLGPDAGEV